MVVLLTAGLNAYAQQEDEIIADSAAMQTVQATDSITSVVVEKAKKLRPKRDWNTWKPNPQRALWLAMVLPGAGQIYNRKFWKLPIIYGGFMGCIYALTWNNMMYKDYSQAYLDLMDDDPGSSCIWVNRFRQRPTRNGIKRFSRAVRTSIAVGAT